MTLYNRYWRGEAFPGIKRPGVKQTTDLFVVLPLGMSAAVPLPPRIPSWLTHRANLPLIFLLYKVLKFLLLFWPFLILMVTCTIINSEFSEVRNFMVVLTEVRHWNFLIVINPVRILTIYRRKACLDITSPVPSAHHVALSLLVPSIQFRLIWSLQ